MSSRLKNVAIVTRASIRRNISQSDLIYLKGEEKRRERQPDIFGKWTRNGSKPREPDAAFYPIETSFTGHESGRLDFRRRSEERDSGEERI